MSYRFIHVFSSGKIIQSTSVICSEKYPAHSGAIYYNDKLKTEIMKNMIKEALI
jgi:hypothetical protein